MQTTTRATVPASTPPAASTSWWTRIGRALTTPRAARVTFPLVFVLSWQLIAPLIPSRILPMPAEVAEDLGEALRGEADGVLQARGAGRADARLAARGHGFGGAGASVRRPRGRKGGAFRNVSPAARLSRR